MDIFSIILFLIYSLIILGILVYVSPLLSAFIMIMLPVIFVIILPDLAVNFFSIAQLSYSGIQVFNLHILLIIWSAFIGIISYAEVLTWYLLRETKQKEEAPAPAKKDVSQPVIDPDTMLFRVKDFMQKLYRILKGEKIKKQS